MRAKMETVGLPEFRENLAGYLESGSPLAIIRHGETLGFYVPARRRNREAAIEALHTAAERSDKTIRSWSADEEELIEEYKAIREASREQQRNGR